MDLILTVICTTTLPEKTMNFPRRLFSAKDQANNITMPSTDLPDSFINKTPRILWCGRGRVVQASRWLLFGGSPETCLNLSHF